MSKLIKAVKWEVKVEGNKRNIQLYDAKGNKVDGDKAYWEGGFYCYNNQLTTLDGAPKEVGGDFYCSNNQLTTLDGAPKEVGGGFYCYNNQLTTLDGAPKEVGGGFYCSNNQLTTLDGAPKEVGGGFYCYDNQLTTKENTPKTQANNRQEILKSISKTKLKRGYLLADGILQKVINTKKKDKIVIYKTKKIGSKKIAYVVREKDVFSHGNTLKEAMTDLIFKLSSKDKTKYKKWTLKTVATKEDMIIAYRIITGACQFGVSEFLKGKKIKSKLSVKEAVTLTEGKWGCSEFKNFFGKELK